MKVLMYVEMLEARPDPPPETAGPDRIMVAEQTQLHDHTVFSLLDLKPHQLVEMLPPLKVMDLDLCSLMRRPNISPDIRDSVCWTTKVVCGLMTKSGGKCKSCLWLFGKPSCWIRCLLVLGSPLAVRMP